MCTGHDGKPGGRPTLLTDELTDRVVGVLRAGGYVETAAQVAGVARERLRDWHRLGDPAGTEARHEVHRRFRSRVEAARAENEARNVALIARAASENWQAAAWLLERTYPERWARPSQRGDQGPGEAPAPVKDDPFGEVDELAARRRHRTD